MLEVQNVSLQFGGRVLFKHVNLVFQKGNCYGIIGANGAGKSTFLKILSQELEPTEGQVVLSEGERMSVLKQDHHAYDHLRVLDTVLEGYPRLMDIQRRKEALYQKEDFSEEDGLLAAELEMEFADLNGYEAESDAQSLLLSLGIPMEKHQWLMAKLDGKEKVKVLLAQALFGNPDILVLDEPTNDLDAMSTMWLENFLYQFENTVLIVSHDRHFLNKVCTRILDVDYGRISMFVGNYDFWYETSQLIARQSRDQNLKKEARIKELEAFIARFSANASKSKQATSRKKELEKITLDDLKPSSRRYPFIDFKFERELGQDVLIIEDLTKKGYFEHLNLVVNRGDKIAVLSANSQITTMLYQILHGEEMPDSGTFRFGITVSVSYLPQDSSAYFTADQSLIDWIRPYSKDQHESVIRGWLGRMLFSGEEALKNIQVLSGGERVRCMLARMMLTAGNVMMLDEPTNHLDLEAITALNKGMIAYKGTMLFTTHDREILSTVANRILYIEPNRIIDRTMSYDEFVDRFLVNS